jgi:hypothetical protein
MSAVCSRMMIKLLGSLLVISAIFVWRFYKKTDYQTEVKKQMIEICADHAGCLQAVNDHLSTCFEMAYSLGSKHKAAKLDEVRFLKCFNDKSSQSYFSVADKQTVDR